MPVVNYIWDEVGDNILMETDENDETIATYVHEPDQHGELISMKRGGKRYYYTYDGEGNTDAVTDENENVVEEATYSAFGEAVEKTSSIVNPFGYKGALGYYANPETGSYDCRARVYEPSIGRWLSADPAGFVDGPNTYVFVLNNPILFVDPSGLACMVCKHYVSYAGVSVSALDNFVIGTPYADLAEGGRQSASVKEIGINFPKLTRTGMWTATNTKTPPPAGTYKKFLYLFYVTFAIHEDQPGDCRLFYDETGSWFNDNGNRNDAPSVDHGDITGRSNNVTAELVTKIGCCDTALIVEDVPSNTATVKASGIYKTAGAGVVVTQNIEIRDKSGNVLDTVNTHVRAYVDPSGLVASFP